MVLHVLPLLLAVSGGPLLPQQAPAAQVQKVAPAPRKMFNETADAKAQIANAVAAIKPDGTRVLVIWGANDDENCAKFQQAMRSASDAKAMGQLLSDEYRSVYVDVGHLDKNQDLAKQYGADLVAGALPHLTILDATGAVVAQQASRAFAATAGSTPFDSAKLLAFLEKHQAPPPPPAGPLFTAAIAQGKRDGKTIFVWFSAPW